MDKIDIMLEQWIKNSIVRKQLRDLIVEVIEKERTKERVKILTWDNQLKNRK
tara:strand:- start:241 stop:396 length:156 start_codon:yes stop_codon:yes gene_type:complete